MGDAENKAGGAWPPRAAQNRGPHGQRCTVQKLPGWGAPVFKCCLKLSKLRGEPQLPASGSCPEGAWRLRVWIALFFLGSL